MSRDRSSFADARPARDPRGRAGCSARRETRQVPVELDIARSERALRDVATLFLDNPLYEPVYLRLERELERARARKDTLARARRIVEGHYPQERSDQLR